MYSKIKNKLILIIALLFFLSFYFWVSTAGYNKFNFIGNKSSCYNLLSDALLGGMLNLPVNPSPELLALSDPYDPIQNFKFRIYDNLHDLSLYKGQIYLYFGLTPVLTLFIPYKIITGNYLDFNIPLFLYSIGIFIFSGLMLINLQEKYFQQTSCLKLFFSFLIIGFCNTTPVLMRRPAVYELAIACGMFFLIGAIYFLTNFINSKKEVSIVQLLLGSLFLGLSVGGRPQNILSAIVLIVVLVKIIRDYPEIFSSKKIKIITALFFPFVFCLFVIAMYNFLRFDNPFEFGTSYQLAGKHIKNAGLMSFERFIPNLYLNLFQPPLINYTFPFFNYDLILPPFINIPEFYNVGGIIGLIPLLPFILLILIYPFILKKTSLFFPHYEFLIIFLPGFINLFILLFQSGAIMRYLGDVTSLLIIPSLIMWFYLTPKYTKFNIKTFLVTVFVLITGIYSIFLNFICSLNAPEGSLKKYNPSVYDAIENLFP